MMAPPVRSREDAAVPGNSPTARGGLLLGDILKILSVGDRSLVLRALAEAEAAGNHDDAALARLVLATRARDRRALEDVIDASGWRLRRNRSSQWLLAAARYWIEGIAAAREEMAAIAAAADVPDERRHEALALVRIAREIEGRDVFRVELGRAPTAPFLAGRELPIVRAAINDAPAEFFIVDTGAPTSLLSLEYCRRLGLTPLPGVHTALDGAGTEIPMSWILVDQVTLGTARVSDVPMKVAPFPPQLRVAGLLNPLDTFRSAVTELDFRQRVLRLVGREHGGRAARESPAAGEAEVVWDGGHPLVPAVVDGTARGLFLFDSGAGANLLTEAFVAATGRQPSTGEPVLGTTLSHPSPVRPGHRGTLAVGDAPPVSTHFMVKPWRPDPHAIAPVDRAGYVGTPWMRGRRILLDPSVPRVRFSAVREAG